MHLSLSRRFHRRTTTLTREVRRLRQHIQELEQRLATYEQRREPASPHAPWWALPEAPATSTDERS